MFSMWACFDHTYLVGPNRGPRIVLLQDTSRSMRSKGLYPTIRQEAGLCAKPDREGMITRSIAGWGKKIGQCFGPPANLSGEEWGLTGLTYSWLLVLMGLQGHALHFTGPPCLRECILPAACFWPVGLDSLGWGVSFASCCLVYPHPH